MGMAGKFTDKLWKKIILWCVLWLPVSHIFQKNPHFPFAIFAPVFGFFSFCEAKGWQGNEFWELTLPWLAFWSVLIAIIDIDLAKRQDGRRIFKLKIRQAFWLAVVLLFGGGGLLLHFEKKSWPAEDCERLKGRYDYEKKVCEFPK